METNVENSPTSGQWRKREIGSFDVKKDKDAYAYFFYHLSRNECRMPDSIRDECVVNASVLNACIKYDNARPVPMAKNITWDEISILVDKIKEKWNHSLPSNARMLFELCVNYEQRGYKALIPIAFRNPMITR